MLLQSLRVGCDVGKMNSEHSSCNIVEFFYKGDEYF